MSLNIGEETIKCAHGRRILSINVMLYTKSDIYNLLEQKQYVNWEKYNITPEKILEQLKNITIQLEDKTKPCICHKQWNCNNRMEGCMKLDDGSIYRSSYNFSYRNKPKKLWHCIMKPLQDSHEI